MSGRHGGAIERALALYQKLHPKPSAPSPMANAMRALSGDAAAVIPPDELARAGSDWRSWTLWNCGAWTKSTEQCSWLAPCGSGMRRLIGNLTVSG